MLSFIIPLLMFGQTLKKYQIETSLKDYTITTIDSFTRISTNKKNVSFLLDEQQPELPYMSIRLLLPKNTDIASVEVKSTGKDHVGKYLLPSNSPAITLDKIFSHNVSAKYDNNRVYPQADVLHYNQVSIDGYQVMYVSVCPFEYDAKTGDLYIKTGLSLNYKITPKKIKQQNNIGHIMRDVVCGFVDNRNEMDELYIINDNEIALHSNYLVVTNNAFKSSFVPLLESKISYGRVPYIISVEDIMQQYSYINGDSLCKIKACIQDYYLNNNVGYVLLGGDCSIIPVRYCHCEDQNLGVQSYDIPTDLYYACVDGDLSWDSNHNGLYGEFSDEGIDIAPDVFISRLPVSNVDEVSNYITKRLLYETDQLYESDSYNKILFAGAQLGATIGGIPDVVYWGNETSNDIHQLCANTEITYLYDVCSNVGDTLYEAASLQRQLNKEFAIVNVDTHGGTDNWFTKADIHSDLNPSEYYTTDSIDNVRSKGNTVMITSACFTNDFTDSESLGRNFLLSGNNGTLLYNGGTREGVIKCRQVVNLNDPYVNIGPIMIDQDILHRFYAGEYNIGVCIYQARLSTLSPNDIVDRWNLYSNNTIGDPDIMLYVEKPDTFKIDAVFSSLNVLLDAFGIECTMYSHYEENEFLNVYIVDENDNIAVFDVLGDNPLFGANKNGYVPFSSKKDFYNNVYIQNVSDFGFSLKGNRFLIGRSVVDDDRISYGDVVVSEGKALNIEVGQELTITNNFLVELGGTLNVNPQ